MPSNEERREVAARLRNYENLRESFRESPICALLDALGVGYLDWKGVCNRLAELIEPEPERICRYESTNRCTWACTSCGREVETFHLGYNYCPRCGAYIEADEENAMFRKVVRP